MVPAEDEVGVELRAAGADGGPVMHGHFAVFNRWTEIDSFFEGRFMEQIAPGAFRKTFREQRDQMRVLFQHGRDPLLADKPLGPIDDLREDDEGAAYEVSLLETPLIRDELLPGLRAGLYGASFRFKVMREEIVDDPEASDYNPHGIQERTIKEAQVMEFGPVTFPAYPEATAGVRSVTDDYFWGVLVRGDADALRVATGDAPVLLQRFVEYRFALDLRTNAIRDEAEDEGAVRDDVPQEDDAEPSGEPALATSPEPIRKAAPGHGPTQLLGTRKEPWRL